MRPSRWSLFFLLIFLPISVSGHLSGCGYTLRSTSMKSPVLENAGIQKVFIQPVTNNSYKTGAEIVVFNALQKKISAQGELRIVSSEDEADAVLKSTVNNAEYSSISSTAGSSLQPTSISGAFKNYVVASVYSAALKCSFSLVATPNSRIKQTGRHVWGATFDRSKSFQANNEVGVLGTTSAIINDSEFDRTLSDLADGMMIDVYESLLSMF